MFDFEVKTEDIVTKPQGVFDFEVDLINSAEKQMNLDEMLTIEQRKSDQEKTDKILDFVNKQLIGIKLSETPEQRI